MFESLLWEAISGGLNSDYGNIVLGEGFQRWIIHKKRKCSLWKLIIHLRKTKGESSNTRQGIKI